MISMANPIKILLIEDDEDDYIIVKDSLSQIEHTQYEIEWIQNYKQTTNTVAADECDVCLLDFRLGSQDGLAVLDKLKREGFNNPIIMLTGQGNRDLDLDAMRLGADDYIEKGQLNPGLLERSIRYCIDRWKNIQILKESQHKLMQLSAKMLQAQEDERKSIAKELHDSIGSNLTAVKFMLESNKNSLSSDPPTIDFSMDKILTTILETIEETQRITKNLRPVSIDRLGFLPSFQAAVRQFCEVNKDIEVSLKIDASEKDVPESLKITLYRIVQEALNNIAKHSGANHVKIKFQITNHLLQLVIEDNGKGFDVAAGKSREFITRNSMGLETMEERVHLSAGRFQIESLKSKGTAIRAEWNLHKTT